MTVEYEALFSVLNKGDVLSYSKDDTALFLCARPHNFLENHKASISCWQPFFPYAEELKSAGYQLVSDLSKSYQTCLCVLGKSREENLWLIAQGMKALEDGGLLICCLSNALGASRYQKNLKQLAGNCEHSSKSKCRIFWSKKTNTLDVKLLNHWDDQGAVRPILNSAFVSQPGIFGWNKIDKGSQLLVKYLPENLSGTGLDLGCGYGYLSKMIAQNCSKVVALYLMEADKRALDCAKKNMEPCREKIEFSYHWGDATRPLPKSLKADFVVMNPPYHEGHKLDYTIAEGFIKTASSALKKGGDLWMVAPYPLPVRDVLDQNFSSVKIIAEEKTKGNAFTIIHAKAA